MPRLPRPTVDGFVYHAINRGNNREVVFHDEEDHRAFLTSLARAKERYPFRLYGYCLMSDHFHLLLGPEPGQSISRILQSITVAHTARYHKQHGSSGHVWQGRFRSPVIQEDEHLLVVLRYIEANPIRAGLIARLADYPWSSYQAHGLGQADPLLSAMPVYEALGRTAAERRSRWRRKVSSKSSEAELQQIRQSLTTGKPLGTPEWIAAHAKELQVNLNPRPRGRPRKTGS